MSEIVNLTPHDVKVLDEDGYPTAVFPPSGTPLRLSTVNLGTKDYGFEDGNGAVMVEMVEFDHLLNPPPRIEGTWYIVSLPCALAHPRDDFLVPYLEVRDNKGAIVGCRMLARPVRTAKGELI